MILTTTPIFSAFSLLQQNLTTQIAIFSKEKYPDNAELSLKHITFIAPNYEQDMYLYCYYPYRNPNGIELNESQRFEISTKNNNLKITLLMPKNMQAVNQILLFLVPCSSIQKYIDELKNVVPPTDGLKNPDLIAYQYSPEDLKKIAGAQKILQNELMMVASMNFIKITDGDTIHLPEYKAKQPVISTAKIVPAHPSAPIPSHPAANSFSEPKHFEKQSNEQILTLRIPEQEIKVGVSLS